MVLTITLYPETRILNTREISREPLGSDSVDLDLNDLGYLNIREL